MTTKDYIDYDLQAIKPVNRLQADLLTVTDTVPAGSYVGKIYSWVTGVNGQIYWELYETYEPGKNMFVRHDPNALKPITPVTANIQVTTPGVVTDLLGENPLTSVTNFFKSGATLLLLGAAALYFFTRRK